MSNPCANTSALKAYERIQAMQEIEQEKLISTAEKLYKANLTMGNFQEWIKSEFADTNLLDQFFAFMQDKDDCYAGEFLRQAFEKDMWDEAMKEAPDYL